MKNNYKKKLLFLTFIGFLSTNLWSQTSTYNYTGAVQTYTVPAGINSIQIETWGAQGGTSTGLDGIEGTGGLGGYAIGNLAVTPGQVLEIYVGGQGAATGPGGYNGGGMASSQYGGEGGGASDVRVGAYTLNDRVIVGGGGGGGAFGSYGTNGGHGGGLIGNAGIDAGGFIGGSGGTQVAGGAMGTSYSGAQDGSFGIGGGTGAYHNAGGGGGWYGGGSGAAHAGAGGGSSYIDGVTSGSTTIGLQTGNGQVIITILCAGLSTTVSATDMCDGELVTLSATSTGTGVVTWDNGVVDSVAFASPIGTTTYTATSTDGNDCAFTVDITVNATPTVDAGQDITLCSGITDTTLTATGAADTFTWDNGVMDGVQFTPTSGVTTYIVTAEYTASGCQATDTLVLMAGSPSISLSATDELFGNDGSASLTILGGIPPFTFDWDNDGTGDNDDNNDLFGVPGGTYTVIMTDASGCTTTETITIGSQLGIDELNVDLSVYPNPTNGMITLSLNGTFEYNVFNALGQDVITGSSTDEVQVDLSSFDNGTYSIKIITEQQTAVVKIVKQ